MHRPQLRPFLFLCFHVGLLLKGRFWAKISVTHAPLKAGSIPVLEIVGSCYKEFPGQEGRRKGRVLVYSSALG